MPEAAAVAVPVVEGGASAGFDARGEASSVPAGSGGSPAAAPAPAPVIPPVSVPFSLDTLPADLKADPSLKGIKTLEVLARNYVETKKMVGRSVQLKEGEVPDEAVYVKLGRPADPAGYKFSKPDFGDKKIELGDEFESHLRAAAFESGLNQKQFDTLVNREVSRIERGYASVKEQMDSWDKELSDTWGANTERNTAIAARAVAYYDPDGSFRKELNRTGLGDHPALAKLFYDRGKQMQEDGLIVGEVGGITSADSAKARIAELRSDPEHLKDTPKGKLLQGELTKLYQLVYGP